MSTAMTASAPLLAHAFRWRRRLAACFAAIMGVTVLLALVATPKYPATSSLLVLLGSEYTVRGNAGEATQASSTPDHEQILRTEAEILQSDALQRETIRTVGLQRLYPEYLDPGWTHRIAHALLGGIQDVLAFIGLMPEHPTAPDPVALAQLRFDRDFSATVLKQGDAIQLEFDHKDPATAAAVVNTLVQLYLDHRRTLYADGQLPLVQAEATRLRGILLAADQRIADFKASNGIASFDTRRDILLHQQGDTEKELAAAQTEYDQVTARLATLRGQLGTTQEWSAQSDDIETETRVSDLRTSLDGLRGRLAQMDTVYVGSGRAVQAVRAQIAAREAELASTLRNRAPTTLHTGENPVWQALQEDALRAAAEQQSARARREAASTELDKLRAELVALGALEQQWQGLQRQRSVAEDDYKSAARLVADREMVESIAAAKQASVRQIAPAAVPVKPEPLRLLILLGGTVLAAFGTGGVLLGSNLLRGVYLLPSELEQDLGIAVLANVPHLPQEAARDLVLTPTNG
jgi:uncharacterized protein involved in exopolysaccharide biosynthesis